MRMKKNIQTISVIVPVYNVEQYLPRCIKSLLLQTYASLEIILVDDGSIDTSGNICDEWQAKDSRIVVIHQENQGVSSARNAGLRIATGDYIGFVDPDDYIDENMYMELYRNIAENGADIAACSLMHEYENGAEQLIADSIDTVMTSMEAIKYDLLHGMYITCNKLFSGKTCNNILYDEKVINGEDRLFDVMALLNSEKVVYINKPYYHYFHRSNSAGTKKYTSKDKSLLYACEKIKSLVKNKDRDLEELAESQIQKAYMQLLGMMKYKADEYKTDGFWIVNEMRKSLSAILINSYNSPRFKLKALLVCLSPKLTEKIVRYKNKT